MLMSRLPDEAVPANENDGIVKDQK